jgi:hypothetical protein
MEPVHTITAGINVSVRQIENYRAMGIYCVKSRAQSFDPHVFESVLVVLCLLMPPRSQATSIAVCRTDKMTAIAVDRSRLAIEDNGQVVSNGACKIHRVNDAAFACIAKGSSYLISPTAMAAVSIRQRPRSKQ